jgi:hypothetical protein
VFDADMKQTAWTKSELDKIARAEELEIATRRRDGTLRDPVTVWMVRVGDDLYVRSVNGRTGAWFRTAVASHQGRVKAGGVKRDVTFVEANDAPIDEIDRAYRAKYGRYAASIVSTVLTPEARGATLRLVPREDARGISRAIWRAKKH